MRSREKLVNKMMEVITVGSELKYENLIEEFEDVPNSEVAFHILNDHGLLSESSLILGIKSKEFLEGVIERHPDSVNAGNIITKRSQKDETIIRNNMINELGEFVKKEALQDVRTTTFFERFSINRADDPNPAITNDML